MNIACRNVAWLAVAVFCLFASSACRADGTGSATLNRAETPSAKAGQSVTMVNRKPDAEKWVTVATIHIDDKVIANVHKALQKANIPVLIGGSLSYGVRVPRQYRDRALTVLESDSRKNRYWILLAR